MKRIMKILTVAVLFFCGCMGKAAAQTLPVSGTFINLPYQDVRNR